MPEFVPRTQTQPKKKERREAGEAQIIARNCHRLVVLTEQVVYAQTAIMRYLISFFFIIASVAPFKGKQAGEGGLAKSRAYFEVEFGAWREYRVRRGMVVSGSFFLWLLVGCLGDKGIGRGAGELVNARLPISFRL